MIQLKLVENINMCDFEEKINKELENLQKIGNKIEDIRFYENMCVIMYKEMYYSVATPKEDKSKIRVTLNR